jgi:hypothetical protein
VEGDQVATKQEVREELLTVMKDPSLDGDVFDELNRRVELLGSEE